MRIEAKLKNMNLSIRLNQSHIHSPAHRPNVTLSFTFSQYDVTELLGERKSYKGQCHIKILA